MRPQVLLVRRRRLVPAIHEPGAHGIGESNDGDQMDDGPVTEQGARGEVMKPDGLAQMPWEHPAFRYPFSNQGMIHVKRGAFEAIQPSGLVVFQKRAIFVRHGCNERQTAQVMEEAGQIGFSGGDQAGVGSRFRCAGRAGQGVPLQVLEMPLAGLDRQAGQGNSEHCAAEIFVSHGMHGIPQQDGLGRGPIRAGQLGHSERTAGQGRIDREKGAGGLHIGRSVEQNGQCPPHNLHGGRQVVYTRNKVS